MSLIEGDQRSQPLGRRSASAVTVYLLLAAVAFSSLSPSPVLADDAVGADGEGGAGAASGSIVLDVYLDAEGRALIVGYIEAEDPEDLAFLEGAEHFYDEDTGELYAKSDGLTSAQGDRTRIEFEAGADWNECHLAFYLPADAGLFAVSCSEGLEYSVSELEGSKVVEVFGYEVDSPQITIEYNLKG
jgi:hypothetical protein